VSVHDFAPQTFGYLFADVRENWVLEKPVASVETEAAAMPKEGGQ
jgi:hypothetical protein